jgi:aspartyl-tRNA(Asn)/glutamyl-tRNA(Gln) amidotransferase subunit B
MPELPAAKERRLVAVGLRDADAASVAYDVELARFLDEALTFGADAQKVTNWLLGDVTGWLGEHETTLSGSALRPAHLAALVRLVDAGTVTGKMAKDLLPDVMLGHDPEALVRERGLAVVNDTAAIEAVVARIVEANPAVVANIRGGNAKAVNALFGQVMKELGGKARPELVRDLLTARVGADG